MSPAMHHQRGGHGAQHNNDKLAGRVRSGRGSDLLVDRVLGIKALQRVIDMRRCQQFPGLTKPGLELGQCGGDRLMFGLREGNVMLCHASVPLVGLSVKQRLWDKPPTLRKSDQLSDIVGTARSRYQLGQKHPLCRPHIDETRRSFRPHLAAAPRRPRREARPQAGLQPDLGNQKQISTPSFVENTPW